MGKIDVTEGVMHTRLSSLKVVLFAAVLTLLHASAGFGHITILPKESTYGVREKYVIRVPNEKQVAAIRIEGEFPSEITIYDFEFKQRWKIEFKKDDKGRIIGATWTGKIAPYEFVEFGMLGLNPKDGPNLLWKFVLYYEDGTKEEFTGAAGLRYPSPVTVLKKGEVPPAN